MRFTIHTDTGAKHGPYGSLVAAQKEVRGEVCGGYAHEGGRAASIGLSGQGRLRTKGTGSPPAGTGELSRKLADLQVKVACLDRELLSYVYVTYLCLRIVSNNILLSLYSCGLAHNATA